MKLDLKEWISKVSNSKVNQKTTVLYNGNKVTSGTITLSDDPSNYDYLVVYTRTNVEYFVDIIPIGSNLTVGQNLSFDHSVTGLVSWIILTPVTNGLYVSAQSNNVNWLLGVIKVVGVKYSWGG